MITKRRGWTAEDKKIGVLTEENKKNVEVTNRCFHPILDEKLWKPRLA
jgi:hypothetical protein